VQIVRNNERETDGEKWATTSGESPKAGYVTNGRRGGSDLKTKKKKTLKKRERRAPWDDNVITLNGELTSIPTGGGSQ